MDKFYTLKKKYIHYQVIFDTEVNLEIQETKYMYI